MSQDNSELEKFTGEKEIELKKATSISDLSIKEFVTGKITRLEIYGAFIDIGLETPAILHVSKIDKPVNRIADLFSVGDEVSVWIEDVDVEKAQITVTMIEPAAVDWSELKEGQTYTGTVSRLEKFGAFVDIGAEKEGLIHVSELSHDYVKHPSEILKTGDEVEVKVIGFNKRKRRIDLSRKRMIEDPESEEAMPDEIDLEEEELVNLPTAMEIALRRAMGDSRKKRSSAKKGGSISRPGDKAFRKQQDDILDRTLKMGKEGSSS
jgi:ribosomal protein S1